MRTPIQYRASSIKNPCAPRLASCLFDFCRISSTNSPFSCKTNPICKNPKTNSTPFSQTTYENISPFDRPKANPKRTQTNPKQTQFPKYPKIDPTSFMERAYAKNPLSPETKANPNEPKQTQLVAA